MMNEALKLILARMQIKNLVAGPYETGFDVSSLSFPGHGREGLLHIRSGIFF
jgi:hypothetical protein